MAVTTMIGARIQRREDPRLITGHGRYVDDMIQNGLVHAAFVRSPHAHARIARVEVAGALRAAGVLAVHTAADFKDVLAGAMPVTNSFVPDKKQALGWRYVADGEAVYQGEVVAMVVADSRYRAADAAALVEVEYEPLPAVIDLEAALEPGSPRAHSEGPDNVAWDFTVGDDVEPLFAEADVVVRRRIVQQRTLAMPMEPRVTIADFSPFEGRLTVWTSSQVPHWVRLCLALGLGMPESHVRVVAPDVGGGFGSKIHIYPEDYLLAAASKRLGRPIKWGETRSENVQASHHGRDQIFDAEIAARRDGTLLALRVKQTLDCGAFTSVFSSFQCSAYAVAGGAYAFRGIAFHGVGALTNKTPTDAVRGAGRPEATHTVERMVDLVAGELGMDPAELRRKNFIREFPYTNYLGLQYDTGDYEKSLRKALEIAGYEDLRRRQADLRGQGRHLGIGLSTWIEACGYGPSAVTSANEPLALVETSTVRVHPTGSVSIFVGTMPHGQSHETTFAQIAADALGIPYDQIEIRFGDTGDTPFGYGTYGSRSLHVGGSAVHISCLKVVDKARKIAANVLEAAEEDVEFEAGSFFVKGSRDRARSMGEIALAAHRDGVPAGMEHGLEATTYYDPKNLSWPFGAHVCVVEVEPETGSIRLEKYVAVDDCGTVINPMIVEGQVHGGVVHSIGQALFEEVRYDPTSGQLRTGSLLDYLMPTAAEIPELVTGSTVTPSTANELGTKGIGEAGTIAASAAVINAVCDALSPFGIKHVDMPASPDRIWKMLAEAKKS
ncbi:MAG: xanthine dehydrogenase family protein molybdopterin-binding subunit [Candidatus Dormibacteraceae bacterium]